MTPIINPWIFYLLSVVNKFQVINIFLIGVLTLFLVGSLIDLQDQLDPWRGRNKEEVIQNYKKKVKYPLIILIINLFLLLLVPGEETLTKMIIANVVTYKNVDAGVDTTKEIIDYVFEKIDNLNAEDE